MRHNPKLLTHQAQLVGLSLPQRRPHVQVHRSYLAVGRLNGFAFHNLAEDRIDWRAACNG